MAVNVVECLDILARPESFLTKYVFAPQEVMSSPLALLDGTARFAVPWVGDWHRNQTERVAPELRYYVAEELVVSGSGQFWLDDALVVAEEVMPAYVKSVIGFPSDPESYANHVRRLPVRFVDYPCFIAVGHGSSVYGHFLIEMMFKIMMWEKIKGGFSPKYKVLLDVKTPIWLLHILERHFSVSRDRIAFFDPAMERVSIQDAIIPGAMLREAGFHPAANTLVSTLLEAMPQQPSFGIADRVFAVRHGFTNPDAPMRTCINEMRLVEIAAREHGFLPVQLEQMSWVDQIALFASSSMTLGLSGSGLHNSIFSRPGTRVGSIKIMNIVQSEISRLRQQRIAYLTAGVGQEATFSVDEDVYREFLNCFTA